MHGHLQHVMPLISERSAVMHDCKRVATLSGKLTFIYCLGYLSHFCLHSCILVSRAFESHLSWWGEEGSAAGLKGRQPHLHPQTLLICWASWWLVVHTAHPHRLSPLSACAFGLHASIRFESPLAVPCVDCTPFQQLCDAKADRALSCTVFEIAQTAAISCTVA